MAGNEEIVIDSDKTYEKFNYYPENLTNSSHKRIIVICDYCQVEYESKQDNIYRSRKKLAKDACNKCKYLKQKESFILHYGVANPSNIKEVQDKREETFMVRYGVKNPTQNKEILDKVHQTCMERYGTISPIKLPEIQKKIKAGHLEKYGTENPCALPQVINKRRDTCLERYGVESPLQNKEILAKVQATNLEKYGNKNAAKTVGVIRKGLETKIERYGTTAPTGMGQAQSKVQDWLKEQGFEFKPCISLLGRKEIDLFNDDLRLGIEYCGLYWHHENSKTPRGRMYHSDKYTICRDQGIRLITIFEDEWLYRQDQVKGFLKSVLGVNDKIYARKCSMRLVESKIGMAFVNENHIQEISKPSLVYFGLYLGEELKGVLSLNRHHRNHNIVEDVVLDRMCFQAGISIIGGASRLFNQAKIWAKENGFKKIVSWSDNRWSQGSIYKTLGFMLEAELNPDYSYVHLKNPDSKRKSKQSMKKSNTGCPKEVKEWEFALSLGYSRIWDCGKKRFVFQL